MLGRQNNFSRELRMERISLPGACDLPVIYYNSPALGASPNVLEKLSAEPWEAKGSGASAAGGNGSRGKRRAWRGSSHTSRLFVL